MTPEGINTGRKTSTAQQTVTVATTSTALVAAAPSRVALIVNAPLANRFTISMLTTAGLDQGLTLYPLGAPLVLTVETHGEIVTRALTAISVNASQNVTVFEVFSST